MPSIEDLMTAAAEDPRSPAWTELYHSVCHQGVCYPDGFPLLPRLADVAAGFEPEARDEVILFAGNLAADADEAEHVRYATALSALRQAAEAWLNTPAEPGLFIYRMQAILALEGDHIWGKELDRIINEELELPCPSCGDDLWVVFGSYGYFATHEDYATGPALARTALAPAAPAELHGLGLRLYTMAIEASQTSVATALTYVFGQATCTLCGTEFPVAEQVSRY